MNAASTPRLLTALVVASLLGNAALLLALSRRPAAPAGNAAGEAGGQKPAGNHPVPQAGQGAASPDPALAEFAAILAGKDPARLHALLLAAGVDSELRLQFMQAVLWKKYEPRLKALDPDQGQESVTIWWKEPGGPVRSGSREERQRNRAYTLLNEEITAEYQRITGEDPDAFDPGRQTWIARQYGGLPREKAEVLYRIGRDYDALENELRNEAGSFELPEDEEKLRLLETERERDIAALLTPEERAAWELRNSDTANQLRHRMTQLDVTEDEYRRIYALQKAFDAEFPTENVPTAPDGSADDFWTRREAAQTALEAGIRALVGEERYTAAALENDSDFTTARAAADRLGLPADTAPRFLALREPAAAESRRIASDPGLSREQKNAALAQLAAGIRAQVVQTLGAGAAEAYFRRGAMNWLEGLEEGKILLLKPGGGYHTIDQPQPSE